LTTTEREKSQAIPIPFRPAIPIASAAAKKRRNRSSSDGRDGEVQDLRGAGAGRRRILPHRRLWYPFFPSHGFRANPSASTLYCMKFAGCACIFVPFNSIPS